MIRFESPLFFLLLVPLGALLWYWNARSYADLDRTRARGLLAMRALGFLALVLALAKPVLELDNDDKVALFCVDVSGHPKTRGHHGTFVLCNAVVVEASRNEKAREGCMSVPDFTGDVKRGSRVVVRGALPGTGEQVEARAEAFEARALQHEIDHCDGLLFLDRVAGAHAVHPRKTYL